MRMERGGFRAAPFFCLGGMIVGRVTAVESQIPDWNLRDETRQQRMGSVVVGAHLTGGGDVLAGK